jgi:kynurenine formamidase
MIRLDRQYGALAAPRVTPELLRLVRTGKVYDLSFPIDASTPFGGTSSPFSMRLDHRHEESPVGGVFGEATELLTMSAHMGTHVDALCHVSEKRQNRPLLHGDIAAAEVESEQGFDALGVQQCPPIVARGLLFDVPRSKGVEVLPDSYGVTADDLEACLRMTGLEIGVGDCPLIRTGFSKYRQSDRSRYVTVGAGPTPEACVWLAEKGIGITGSDTLSYERVPSAHLGHLELIRRRGIPMMKQVNLEELAGDSVYEFVFFVLPLRLVGATASPVTPIAIC